MYNFSENNGIAHRFNNEVKLAGQEWLKKFMDDFGFSFRTPESTSVGPLMCFNKTNVDSFFSVLKEIRLQNKYTSHQIYNVDETGLSTVPTRQPKVISPLGTKRVANISSGERGKNVTVVCGMSSSGQYILPFLYSFGNVCVQNL